MSEVKIERLVKALRKAGFRKIEGDEKLEILAELPRMLMDEKNDVFFNEFIESGYSYGYVAIIGGPCRGCWDIFVVIIHRGWTEEEDYKFSDVEVWYKALGYEDL